VAAVYGYDQVNRLVFFRSKTRPASDL